MSKLSKAELDDLRARNPVADVAGGYVQLRRMGGRLVGPCPICGGRKSSQRFELKGDDAWTCAVCEDGGDVIRLIEKVEGVDFRSAVERLGGRRAVDGETAKRLFEERERKRLAREAQSADYREKERKRLWISWNDALPVHGSPVEAYLSGRGLQVPESCPGLRYQPQMIFWHGENHDSHGRSLPRALHTGPAMLAAFIRPDGHFGGLHITWLSADARPAKVALTDPETGEVLPAKKMRGSKTGAHILIASASPGVIAKRLFVGEGIETVLAVWTAHRIAGRDLTSTAFWAAGDLGNMAGRATETVAHPTLKRPDGRAQRVPGPMPDPDDAGLAIADEVEELTLLGDGDSERVLTDYAMERGARRYTRPGRSIRIAFAPDEQDFNNVLQSEEAAA
jgi:hypothetical protein